MSNFEVRDVLMSVSIKPIGNKSQNTNFTSKEDDNIAMSKRDIASAFVNMSNREIRELAYVSSYDKHRENKQRSALLSTLYAMPIVASAAEGILTKGHLDKKVSAAGKMAAHWGFGLLMLGAYSVVKNAIVDGSPGLKKFEKENPAPAIIVDLAAFLGVAMLGFRGAGKMGEMISKALPKTVDEMHSNVSHFKKWLNKTEINKKVLPALNEGVDNLSIHLPVVTEIGRFLVENSVWVLLFGGLIKSAKYANNDRRRVEETYHELKQAQFDTAKQLSKIYEVERNVMAQKCEKCGSKENTKLKEEMEEEFDKTID